MLPSSSLEIFNKLPDEIKSVVEFISSRVEAKNQWLRKFTKDEISLMVLEKIRDRQCQCVFDGGQITGVIFYDPNRNNSGEFWVEQIWCDDRRAMLCFLSQLAKQFPSVSVVRGWRRRSNTIKQFSVSKLNQIFNYGK